MPRDIGQVAGGGAMKERGREHMQIWRYILALIAIICGGALAVMNVAGSYGAFTDPRIAYGAAGVGLVADFGIVALMFCIKDAIKRRSWVALMLAVLFWIAFSAYTVVQGGKWLEHGLEVAQKPVKQQELTEKQKQDDLKAERSYRDEADKVALSGASKAVRDNATKQAADARARIKELENTNTFEMAAAEVEEPVKSPFAGYERLLAFVLWAASQACWFLAFDGKATEAESAAQKRRGTGSGDRQRSSPRGEKAARPKRQISAPSPAGKAAKVLPFRRKPSQSEVAEMLSSGKTQQDVADHFGYSVRTIRNIMRAYEPQEQTA
jgi:hypothetical protein